MSGNNIPNEPTPEAIRECYINQNMTQLEIAAYFGCDVRKIRRLMKQEGIEVRSISEHVQKKREASPDYVPHYSKPRVPSTLKKYDFTYKELYDCYISKRLSTRQIGKIYGVSRATVSKTLKQLKIPARPFSTKPRIVIGGYQGSLRNFYNRYKESARLRDISFQLSLEVFETIVTQHCYYCGCKPTIKVGKHLFGGIDRVDNNQGYIPGNARPCCGTCNKAKLARSEQEFISWVLRTAEHLQSKITTSEQGGESA